MIPFRVLGGCRRWDDRPPRRAYAWLMGAAEEFLQEWDELADALETPLAAQEKVHDEVSAVRKALGAATAFSFSKLKSPAEYVEQAMRADVLQRRLIDLSLQTGASTNVLVAFGARLSNLQHLLTMQGSLHVPASSADPKRAIQLAQEFQKRNQRVSQMTARWAKLFR